MLILLRKLKKKKQRIELEIVDLINNIKYVGTLREGKKISLYKCREIVRDNIKPIQPSKVLSFLKNSKKVYLVEDSPKKNKDEKEDDYLKILKFLEENCIKYTTIKLCPFCLIKGKYNQIDDKRGYKYNHHTICLECAVNEVKREVDIEEKFIEKFLRKFRDVNKVIDIFTTKNPLKEPELTKYDVIKSSDMDNIKNYKIEQLNIPHILKKSIMEREIKELLPVQTLSVKGGLLDGKDLLIVSSTSSGKTLIGELAFIKNILEGKGKAIFLVPLVSLANQKYLEFKERYEKIGLSVSLRVGLGRLSENKYDYINTDINSDIIVGTYEGVDFLLRSGKLRDVGTVVIDEVHSLNLEERGPRLDGLIGRLRYLKNLNKNIQMIYLSATIGNPEELSKKLKCNLVLYDGRPVPLERHIIFTKNEYQKLNIIKDIVKNEFRIKSKYGYRGQCLIFTYSRKRTEYIANFLKSKGISCDYYHAGMEYRRRREVEDKFLKQKLMCVITTSALAAGVDFPASSVILESLSMGPNLLNPSEFQQMCGRAGRKGMHDIGKVYMVVEMGKKYRGDSNITEDSLAFKLLNSKPENVDLEYNEDEEEEQILSNVCFLNKYLKEVDINMVKKVPLLGTNHDLKTTINQLKDNYGMVVVKNRNIVPTKYGYATSLSFLYPKEANFIKEHLNEDVLDITTSLKPFENLYLPNKIKNKLSKILNINLPTKFIDSYSIIVENSQKIVKECDKDIRDTILQWMTDFEGLTEEEILKVLSKKILYLRMGKKTPSQISRELISNYSIQVYSGDVFSYLENTILLVDAIERIKLSFNKNTEKERTLKNKLSNPFKW